MKNGKYQIGVLCGNTQTDHPYRLLKRIYEGLNKKECDVYFFLGTESESFLRGHSYGDKSYDYQYLYIYDYREFLELDAMIVSYGTICIYKPRAAHISKKLFSLDIPIILLEEVAPEGTDLIYLITDNYEGQASVVRHLIEEHQLKNILYLRGPVGNRDADERFRAYLDEMEAHGLEVRDEMIGTGDFNESVDVIVEKMLLDNPGAEAIVSANDEMCHGIYRACQKAGLVIGKDIAVTGFDNIENAQYMKPPLTTVRQESDLMGIEAAKKCLAVLKGREVSSERLPVRFIERASCGGSYDPESEAAIRKDSDETVPMQSISDRMEAYHNFQTNIWLGSVLVRSLMEEDSDEASFFTAVADRMKILGAKRSFLFLGDPVRYNSVTDWKKPENFRLVMKQDADMAEGYGPDDAVEINDECSLQDIVSVKGPGRQLMNFLIYDRETQYGILMVEIEPEDVRYFYIISLQIGTALHFFELTNQHRAFQSELESKNRVLEWSSTHDPLTQLYNRDGFVKEIDSLLRKGFEGRLTVLMADLDHLKQINDKLGHAAGDDAIISAANILKKAVEDNGIVCRSGGDEFYIIYTRKDDEDIEAKRLTIKTMCEDFNKHSTRKFVLSISVGIADAEGLTVETYSDYFTEADNSLYDAKLLRPRSVIRRKSSGSKETESDQ